jgi:small subunit ribosomal protein S19
MVGHKLGEFALTRTFKVHTGDKKVVAPTSGTPVSAPGSASPAAPAAGGKK